MLLRKKIARHVSEWPGMDAQTVTGRTVIAWREQQRRSSGEQRKRFEKLVEVTLAEPQPRRTIKGLLNAGPPGSWKS